MRKILTDKLLTEEGLNKNLLNGIDWSPKNDNWLTN